MDVQIINKLTKTKEMKNFIRENTWLSRDVINVGWGNGYVLIPKGHILHGLDYDDINVDVHGGLTFSALVDSEMIKSWNLDNDDEGAWCIGFDTAHYGDSLSNWPKEAVQEETDRLMNQILSFPN